MAAVLIVVLCASAVYGQQATGAERADGWLRACGLKAGFAYLPDCRDADAALALAARPGWVVLAVVPPEQAEAVRTRALEEGLLNNQLYVDSQPPGLALGSVDLLVSDRSGPGAQTVAEWVALLTPRRGVMLLPESAREDVPDGPQVKADGGRLVVTAPGREGGDQWTHRYHAPDNNFYSRDTYLRPPFVTQWWGLPIHDSFWGTTVLAAGGRYAVLDGSSRGRRSPQLTVRSLGNGAVLWRRDLEAPESTVRDGRFGTAYNTGRSGAVLTEDDLFLIQGYEVLQVRAETGAEVARFASPLPDGQVKWISVHEGRLAMLAGPPDRANMHIYYVAARNAHGKHLMVYDLESGNTLWEAQTAAPVDERQVAIRGNRLFAVVRGTAVQCRDATTGKVLWSNEQPEVVEALEWKQDTGALFQTQRALTVEGGIVFYGASYTRNFVSLDADTGELLSIVPMKEGGRGIKGVLENGRWIGQRQVFDTRTGKEIDSTHMTSGSCGPSLATPLMFCGGFGNVLLRASEQIVREKDVKSPCDIGMIVCDGIALSAASSCVCNLEMRGYRAFTHRATVRPQQRTSRERLQVLSDAPAARPPADELDWPAHRHDTGRGAATPARIGRGLAPQWRWSPPRAVDYVPSEHGGGRRAHVSTEPDVRGSGVIAAGDAVYFGDAYGVLRCVDATDGTERWAFPTAGPIPHAPAYWQGRVYLGDSDGTIHCLNARTGEPVWKFDAAPAQRRVFWYSKLVNTWPILGGVTLHGGRLYAVAGYQQDNGIHVWCLDAATGREVWSRHDVAQGTEEHGLAAAPGAYGTTCVAGGRLYLASGTLAPASFDLETGDWKCLPRLGRDHVTRRGAGVGALAAGWVMTFDRRLSFVHDVWAKRDKGLGCTLTRTDFDGKGWAAVGLPGLFNLPPAWDDDMIVMVEGGQVGPLVALAREDLVNAVHKDVQAEPGRRDYPVPTRILGEASFKAKELGLPRRWGPLELECVSVVLAEDAVVVTHALGGWRSKRRRRFSLEGWALSIVDRQSGAVRQRIELPEQPVVDQLCVDRAGRVLVGLRDGSVAAYGR